MSDLSEMQAFEVEKFKIDFTQPPHLIRQKILGLPIRDQQKWIDLWLEQPEIKKDLERKRLERMKHPDPINVKKRDSHWQD